MDVTSERSTLIARSGSELDAARLFAAAEPDFARYEMVKDLVDECIDLSLNYRQSGHPGGSRSKVHMMLSLLLSGAMRWDVLRPWRRFGDRFVLSAGHTVPLVYATLAVLNEAMRARHRAHRGGRVRVPRRRPLGADLGVAAEAAPPRRPARARGDGRPDAVPEVQHRPFRARHAARRRRGAQPEAGRGRARSRCSCSRARAGSLRAPRTRPRTRPGAWAWTTWSSWSTGTTSGSTPGRPRAWSRARRWTGSRRTAGGSPAPSTAWSGARSPRPCWRRPAAPIPATCRPWPGSAPRRAAATARSTRPATAPPGR